MGDFDVEKLLKQISELEAELKAAKKYGLVWDKESVPEKNALKVLDNIPFLTPISRFNIQNNKDSSVVIIEGDNYHSLVALSTVLADKVNIIYIDPPYNTGIKDFIYNDKYVNLDDAYYHSSWLNFMEKRLKLARELLSKHGIIYISIDNHELFQLKLLCDSIFNERNFLGCLIQNKNNSQNDAANFQENHDYILCYAKSRLYSSDGSGGKKEISLVNTIDYDKIELLKENDEFYYIGREIHKTGSNSQLIDRKLLGYTIYYNPANKDIIAKMDYNPEVVTPDSTESIFTDDSELIKQGYIPVHAPMQDGKLGRWTWAMDNVNENKHNLIAVKNKSGGYIFKKKIIVKSENVKKENGKYYFYVSKKVNVRSILNYSTAEGTSQLKAIFGEKIFDNPKNVEMIKYLIRISDYYKNPVVLDFFAGSGTTGQAVLELNKEDGQNRFCILCNNNENNICTDITYPRVKTIITGKCPNGKHYSDGIPSNLYYFQTEFIKDENNTEQAKYNLVEKIDSLLCIAENIFDEKERNDYSSHFTNGQKHLFIYNDYFNVYKFDEFKSRVLAANGEKIVYVYSSDNSIDNTLIDRVDVMVKPIPSKIYEIYKEIVEDIKRGE